MAGRSHSFRGRKIADISFYFKILGITLRIPELSPSGAYLRFRRRRGALMEGALNEIVPDMIVVVFFWNI